MEEQEKVDVDELVVLSKFEGEAKPENEIERITIHNGEVISHEIIQDGKPVGTVKEVD